LAFGCSLGISDSFIYTNYPFLNPLISFRLDQELCTSNSSSAVHCGFGRNSLCFALRLELGIENIAQCITE
jgi:hypothetical protein